MQHLAPAKPADKAGARRLSVTVLYGGPGAERAVSLDSGKAVAEALRRRGHKVYLADITPDNLAALDRAADVVFPALHGTWGEDGKLQTILEERGVRFVGAGSAASALSFDKVACKDLAAAAGIPTPAYFVVERDKPDAAASPWQGPVVVKPVDQGSSVDTFVVKRESDFLPAVETVLGHHGRALVETYIAGEELTVGILGDRPLPSICIRPRAEFYDYEAKYEDGATEYVFDAGLPAALLESAATMSMGMFAGVGCRHLARVDWMLDREQRLWFLEINTLPGFTSHSLLPKAAARIGIAFDELVERLVRLTYEDQA